MGEIKDGGPAFPFERSSNRYDEMIAAQQQAVYGQGSQQGMQPTPYIPEKIFLPGMSLRDWFAGMALEGMLAHGFVPDKSMKAVKSIGNLASRWAFEYADAMLKERERNQ